MAEFDDKLNSILSNPEAMAQIAQLAQSLSGGAEGGAGGSPPPPPPQARPGGFPPPPSQPPPPPPAGGDPLSGLGGLDPELLTRFLPLIRELGGQQDSNARQLLYALQPYLKPERQAKVERALLLARLFRVGRKFLTGREG